MAFALTGFAFYGNTENGGVGVKIGIYHVQGAQVANKTARKSRRDGEGRIKYDGEIISEKVYVYMVDCTMTGENAGTLDTPKLSFKCLFK